MQVKFTSTAEETPSRATAGEDGTDASFGENTNREGVWCFQLLLLADYTSSHARAVTEMIAQKCRFVAAESQYCDAA